MIAGVDLRPLSLRPLTEADAPAAARLSAAVGWNQDLADWQRLIALHPEGSLGAWRDAELVGTATLVNYGGRVAWLGMVIVAPDERGKGIGGALVDAALAGPALAGPALVDPALVDRSLVDPTSGDPTSGDPALADPVSVDPASGDPVSGDPVSVDAALTTGVLPEGAPNRGPDPVRVGLDATEFGAPLYERRGFRKVALVDRWAGALAAGHAAAAAEFEVSRASATDTRRLASFDATATGIDRSRLLERLLVEPSTRVVVAEAGSEIFGYGVLRSGRTRSQVGPLVVSDDGALGPVVSALAEHLAHGPIYLDAVRLPARTTYLESLGLSVSRTLLRMARPAEPVMCGEGVVAATGFEWG